MGRHKKSSAETQAAAAVEGDAELVSMATVKSLLAVQESIPKSLFEAVLVEPSTLYLKELAAASFYCTSFQIQTGQKVAR